MPWSYYAMIMEKSKSLVKPTKVLVFGTFDMVHDGHRNLFQQARQLAKKVKLIVSLAREKNVLRIKGRVPRKSEQQRLAQVRKLPEVDTAVLGGIRHHMPHIIRLKPDIIALGYDQRAYVTGLRAELKAAGLKTKVVRLNPYQAHKFKTSLLQK